MKKIFTKQNIYIHVHMYVHMHFDIISQHNNKTTFNSTAQLKFPLFLIAFISVDEPVQLFL